MKTKKTIDRLKASFGMLKETHFQFDMIEQFFRNKEHSTAFQVLSDKTYKDLDLTEVFMFLDRTTSKIGQQYLYNQLRCIPHDADKLTIKEELITRFTEDANFRLTTQLQLDKLNADETFHIASLFQEMHSKPPRWFFLVKLLFAASISCIALFAFIPQLFFLFLPVVIINVGVHYWNKRNLYKYSGTIPQLLRLNTIASLLHKDQSLHVLAPNLNESIEVINKVKIRMSFFRLNSGLQSEMETLVYSILELINIIFILEPLLLFSVLDRLDTKRKEIEAVYSFVGEIDSLLSIASLRAGLNTYCLPKLDDEKMTTVKIYHPLIKNCVTNNISVEKRSILLTGSNMSGKTSFIRTIGINAITGLTLNTCFAESMCMPRLQIHSAIRISDDLLNDKSYYFEEVLTIKEMIDNSANGSANLFLLDEIFKGTNTVERIAAGKGVLSHLAQSNNIVLVSTHDIELSDLLCQTYDLYHFSEIINEKAIDFDYKLKEGKLKNRNAIRILEINNFPKKIITEAIAIAQDLDKMEKS